MSWLDALLTRGEEATRQPEAKTIRQPEKKAPAPRKPRPKREIVSFWVQTGAPIDESDPGSAEICSYYVDDGVLHLCDENGKSKDKSHPIGPNDNPRTIAARLWRADWEKDRGGDFNRPLHYRPLGCLGVPSVGVIDLSVKGGRVNLFEKNDAKGRGLYMSHSIKPCNVRQRSISLRNDHTWTARSKAYYIPRGNH
jgi:hypothetical protein